MRRIILMIFLLMGICVPFAHADTLLDDDFTNTSKVDTSKTNSWVDTANGMVELPFSALPNALALNQYAGKGYAVAKSDGVSFYSYDDASGKVQELNTLKINVTNPLAVSLYKEDMAAYILMPNGDIKYYQMGGTGFVENPSLSILGTNQVISISSVETDTGKMLLTLSKDGTVQSYSSTGSNMVAVPQISLSGITNPVSISSVPNHSLDFVVTTQAGATYYAFDGSTFQPMQLLSGLNGIVSAQVDKSGDYIAAIDNTVSVYLNSGGNNLVDTTSIFGQSLADKPFSVSLNTDIYHYGVLTEDGKVHYYEMNGGSAVEDTSMTLTGLNLAKWYSVQSYYYSVPITSPFPVDVVKLTTIEQNDTNTSNNFEISTDGGSSFFSIIPGDWQDVTPGSSIVLRAKQSTSDPSNTPRIDRVILEGGQLSIGSLTVTKQYSPGPGQTAPLPTTIFPVYERAGGQVEFTVKTTGVATSVVANFSDGKTLNLVPVNPITNEINTWFGWYEVPVDATQGQVIGITLVANRGIKTKQIIEPHFITIDGTVQGTLNIRLIR